MAAYLIGLKCKTRPIFLRAFSRFPIILLNVHILFKFGMFYGYTCSGKYVLYLSLNGFFKKNHSHTPTEIVPLISKQIGNGYFPIRKF